MSAVTNLVAVEGWKTLEEQFGNATEGLEGEQPIDIIGAMGFEQLSDEMLVDNHRAAADPNLSRQYVDELFRRNHLKIARWCYRFTRDRDSAADLAQEVCSKAYRNLSSFQNQSKFSTWLFSIARNHCVNALRSQA